MGKSLVIVESPAKAKTINRYLGSDFLVKSSVGHIRDLPTAGSRKPALDPKERARQAALTRKMPAEQKTAYLKKKNHTRLIESMGIDPENHWAASYQILPGKEKVVSELRKLARGAGTIYLATDLDREGEAIAWHLQEAIGGDPERYQRVVFNEITKSAIQKAFQNPGQLDTHRVNAQQARRFLDRLVGYIVSPLLWAKVARGLSAGRVQSVAVRLLVEREREIHAFNPEEFWELHAQLQSRAGEEARFQVRKYQGLEFRPVSRQQAHGALDELQVVPYQVGKREDKPTRSPPPAPFITSTLQQSASTRLGFSVKKTMALAQRLYEAGYITYMRTDSTNLSSTAVSACRAHIGKNFPPAYLPERPNFFASKKGAQEAHEAIRPTDVAVQRQDLRSMEPDTERLYALIWSQFVASQMTAARYLTTTITVNAGEYSLLAGGRIIQFDGFTRVLRPLGKRDKDIILPDLKPGDPVTLLKLEPSQHFTKPLPRYGEASLVREMEKRGIGRPSTYASIISTIQERGYVRLENKRFYAEKMGDIVTERLVESFSDLLDYGFTAAMEQRLDEVAEGKLDWRDLLDEFYQDFSRKVQAAGQEPGGMRPNQPTMTDLSCSRCGRPMQVRTASTGVFLGCSGYGLPPNERCKSTLNLTPGDEAVSEDADDEAESRQLVTRHRCGACNTAMDSYLIDENRKLHLCGNNPDCAGFEVESGAFKIKGYDGPVLECDKCGAGMQLENGRFGKYFACTGDGCKNTRKLLRNGQAAPPRMNPVPMPELRCQKTDDNYVLRDGAAGLFLAASKFPRNRETRAPYVDEILPYLKEIDSKYSFLFSAPLTDTAGNRTQIRFSRKTREQYVMTEANGKATGWKAFYQDNAWVVGRGR